jgi:uncharacterized membrane protein YbhN (UPF0104 family)
MLKPPATVSSSGTSREQRLPPSPPGREGEPRAPAEREADLQRSLVSRALSPHTLVSFALALAILWFVVRRLDVDLSAILSQIRRANPLLLAVAFILWYGAFFARGWRWGRMLESAGVASAPGREVPAATGLAQVILLAYFANSLVPAKLGDAYRAYLLKREGNIPLSAGFGSILAERLVDAMMLVIVLASAVFVVFGRDLPSQASPALTLGAVLLIAGTVGLALMWLTRDTIVRYLPDRPRETYARLHEAVFGSLRRPFLVFGLGMLFWFGDGMRVWFVSHALGAALPPSVTILVATMGALLTVIPFTPAGLGVVELGVGSILIGVLGLDPALAGSIILLDRVVAYWSLLLVGGALYLWRTRRDLRQQDSSAGAPS